MTNTDKRGTDTRDIQEQAFASDWIAYDHAAEDLARRGKTGAIGDALPANMSASSVALINADPEAFETRVRAFAYRLAMLRSAIRCVHCEYSADDVRAEASVPDPICCEVTA